MQAFPKYRGGAMFLLSLRYRWQGFEDCRQSSEDDTSIDVAARVKTQEVNLLFVVKPKSLCCDLVLEY